MIRLFVGLTLPEHHRQRLSALGCGVEGARWVTVENLHITLRFIGEVDEDQAEDLAAALDLVTADPFEVSIKGLGTFGHPPHSAWAGVVDTPPGALAALHANVESALVRAGLKPEGRKYTPHVTLARLRHVQEARLARFMEGSADLSLSLFSVTKFTLFESHLSPSGAHYESVAAFDFQRFKA